MTLAELLAELDALATLAAKFAEVEPEFVSRFNKALAQVKVLVPASTLEAVKTAAKQDLDKVVDFFKHKKI